jgi:ketosteroid isomerase-like protein
MQRFLLVVASILVGFSYNLSADEYDPEQFANTYFAAWIATQKPTATSEDLENYLSLLTDDVGHQHLPYDSDDTRYPDGKESMREGMTYYLGKHIEYSAKLTNVVYGLNVVAIQFQVSVKARRGPEEPVISREFSTLEVLEIEDGKVSMIRKYN